MIDELNEIDREDKTIGFWACSLHQVPNAALKMLNDAFRFFDILKSLC